MKHITVLGEGAFGTAIACLLADSNVQVTLWCHNPAVAQEIATNRINTLYLPEVNLPELIIPVTDYGQALQDAQVIFVAIPVKYLRSVLEQALPFYQPHQLWVLLCKGIETETLMLPTQIVDDVFGDACLKAVVMGPSFARELAAKQPTQVVVACEHPEIAQHLQELVSTPYFNAELGDDPIGVQLCGAYKNIIALGAGMLEGAGYGHNTRALLITKGLYEMATLVTNVGGNQETVFGLAGLGDLVLTACSESSRNVMVGKWLARGESLEHILQKTKIIPEGVTTAQALSSFSKEAAIPLPLCQAIARIVEDHKFINELVNELKSLYKLEKIA